MCAVERNPGGPERTRFVDRVFAIVAQIPKGRVTTYGDIARAMGKPNGARQVGWAVARPPSGVNLPFHRVVNRDGYLSGGWAFGHPEIMKQFLIADGVPFRGEYTVDLRQCRWIPGEESASADKVDDLEYIAVLDEDGAERVSLDDLAVALDDHEPLMEVSSSKKRGDRCPHR